MTRSIYTNDEDFGRAFTFARDHRAALHAVRTDRGFRLAGYAVHSRTAAESIELGYRVRMAMDDQRPRRRLPAGWGTTAQNTRDGSWEQPWPRS